MKKKDKTRDEDEVDVRNDIELEIEHKKRRLIIESSDED